MLLSPAQHLAYCTNIHRGESWPEIFHALQRHTLAVRRRVCPDRPYAIGLRLSDHASRELSEPAALLAFQKWLEKHQCYVFTINGFPYGQFHGARVKEQVYAPDWTSRERLEYTNRLFDLLAQLAPAGVAGSVSTVPGSFKEFIRGPEQVKAMRDNLWRCVEHIAEVSRRSGRELHLGLEPEPLCYLETTAETVAFFDQMRADRPKDDRLAEHLGVNYDACHLAVEYEEPQQAISRLRQHQVRISKIHLSSALKASPTPEVRDALDGFAESIYLHQVVERRTDGTIQRYRDLDEALNPPPTVRNQLSTIHHQPVEWRIHFHVPLHSPPMPLFDNTTDHLLGVFDALRRDPKLCSHLEMETYTWEVLPPALKPRSVVEQLVGEYDWTLRRLAEHGFTPVA